MRLINARTLRFQDFLDGSLPRYAILSHTWENEEVTLQDMSQPYLPSKSGYEKITETCRLALDMGIEYAWVDTCCIDKSSSAELTESINSMFQWYKNAAVCYVYLADLESDLEFGDGIGKSRWIERGWTLQELIAPWNVQFYDGAWKLRGAKTMFNVELSAATGIPVEILSMEHKIDKYSVAQRISWASMRKTTRVEDAAYSLLGILEVNMPLIYGEGAMAFRRLQEEIVKRSNDLTVFAWNPQPWEQGNEHCSLLATSPANFFNSGDIVPWKIYNYNPEFSITNKGLRVEERLYITTSTQNEQQAKYEYVFLLGLSSRNKAMEVGIRLRKVGPSLFLRQSRELKTLDSETYASLPVTSASTFYIMTSTATPDDLILSKFRAHSARISLQYSIQSLVPDVLWDSTDCLFYADYPHFVRAITFDTILNGRTVRFAVLCDHGSPKYRPGRCYIFETDKYAVQTAYLFRRREFNRALRWRDLDVDYPELFMLGSQVVVTVDGMSFILTVCLEVEEVESFRNQVSMYRLGLDVKNTLTVQ